MSVAFIKAMAYLISATLFLGFSCFFVGIIYKEMLGPSVFTVHERIGWCLLFISVQLVFTVGLFALWRYGIPSI